MVILRVQSDISLFATLISLMGELIFILRLSSLSDHMVHWSIAMTLGRRACGDCSASTASRNSRKSRRKQRSGYGRRRHSSVTMQSLHSFKNGAGVGKPLRAVEAFEFSEFLLL